MTTTTQLMLQKGLDPREPEQSSISTTTLCPFLVTELAIKLFSHIDSRTYWSARQVCSLWYQVGRSADARRHQVDRIQEEFYLPDLVKYRCWEDSEESEGSRASSTAPQQQSPGRPSIVRRDTSSRTPKLCKCHDSMGFKFRSLERYWERWSESDESLRILEKLLFTRYDLHKTMTLNIVNGKIEEFYDEKCRFTSYKVHGESQSAQIFVLSNAIFAINADHSVHRNQECHHLNDDHGEYKLRRVTQDRQHLKVTEFTPRRDTVVYEEMLDEEWVAASGRLVCDEKVLMVQKDQSLLQDDTDSPFCEVRLVRLDTGEQFIANFLSTYIEEDVDSIIVHYHGAEKIRYLVVPKNLDTSGSFDETWEQLKKALRDVARQGDSVTLWNPRIAKKPVYRNGQVIWYGKWSYKLCSRCACNEWLFELEIPQTESRRLIKCPKSEMFPFDLGLAERQPPNEPCKQYYTGATVYRVNPEIMQSKSIKDIDFYPGRFLKPPGVEGRKGDLNYITGRIFAHRVTESLLNVYELRQEPPSEPVMDYTLELGNLEEPIQVSLRRN